jgi:hypothetical protein
MCALCQQLGLDFHKLNVGVTDGTADGAAAWAALPGGSGTDAEGPGSDTVLGSTGTSSTMSGGTSVRGYINGNGDQDWYAVTLTAGQTYTFALSGFGRGALSDGYLRLLNSSGTQVAFDDDSGPLANSKLTFTASTSGTYFISAEGYGGSTTGQYLLTMATGTTPYAPTVSVTDIADYLTNSYWEVNGSIAHHWGVSTISYNVQGLSTARADLARVAFQLWSEVANLTFVETTGTGQITLDDTQSGAFASSSYAGNGIITSANINVDPTWYGSSSAIDSYTLQTFIHEIGHALGLGHAGPYNGSASYGVDNTYANDTWQYTVMSYMAESNYGGASYRFTMTPMMADILAIQNLYGAPTAHAGDTVYGFGSTAGSIYNFSTYSQAPSLTIFDSGGTDTLNCSGYSQNQVINLTGGSFSNVGGLVGNIGIYTTAVIENAIGGSGADTITGNSASNTLTGNGGNDTLNGGAGDDTLDGGIGNDTAVYSGNHTQYVITLNTNGSYSLLDQRSGSPDGLDIVSNVELFQFTDGTYTASQLNTNHAPVVTVSNLSSPASTVRSASSLFSVADADNNAMTKYQFWDATTGGGYFTVNGVVQGANQIIEVTAAQLSQVSFVVGTGVDDLYIRACDGSSWSVAVGAWDHFTVTGSVPTTNHAPVVTVADKSGTVGQTLSASSLFSVADADNDTITKYQFWDATTAGGYFTVNGVTQGANQIIEVTAAQLAQTSFVVGAGGDDLFVRAYDGTTWSVATGAWDHFHVTASAPTTNHAPVVTVADKSATVGQTLSGSSLFSVADADNDTITKYQFWDATTAGGYFTVNGVTQGANQIIEVTAAQLAQTSFVVGAGGDDLFVRAYDGTTWSVATGAWDHFHVTASAPTTNHAPVVTVADRSATAGQTLSASSLFSVTDADNDTITKYQFWDGTTGGGHFTVNGVTQGVNQIIEVTAAQLAQTSFVVGAGGDDLYVRAYDGTTWSVATGVWDHFHLTA